MWLGDIVSVVWEGRVDGYLTEEEVRRITRKGLERLPVDGRRVLVIVPDGTRTMPMPLMFEILDRELGPRVVALDFLVALGMHSPMDDAHLGRLVGRRSSTAARAGGRSSITGGTTRLRSSQLGTHPGR